MIYLTLTFFLDILLSMFISVSYQNISIIFPCVLIGSIPVFYTIVKNKKFFLIVIIIIGIIYDTIYSDVFLLNTYYFILYGLFLYVYYKNKSIKLFNILILSVIGVILYDVFIFFTLILLEYSKFDFSYLCYKIKNTFLLNFIYVSISIILLKGRILEPKNSKK